MITVTTTICIVTVTNNYNIKTPLPGKLALKEGSYTVIGTKDYKICHEGKDSDEPLRVVRNTCHV